MGFAIRIGLHNSYDVILYVWRPYLKRRLHLLGGMRLPPPPRERPKIRHARRR